MDILPSSRQLGGAEIELVEESNREKKLKEQVDRLREDYDYIIIDAPPTLGLLTLNGLNAADGLLVPLQCEYYALEGLGDITNTFQLVKRHMNPNLELEGILLTMYDGRRTNLAQEVAEEVRAHFKDKVFQTVIPRTVRLSEAPSYGMPILEYDPKSKGAEVYEALAKGGDQTWQKTEINEDWGRGLGALIPAAEEEFMMENSKKPSNTAAPENNEGEACFRSSTCFKD